MWLKDSALQVYPLGTVSDVTECPKPWGNLPLGLGQCVLPGTSLLNQIRTVSDDTERPKMTCRLRKLGRSVMPPSVLRHIA